MSKRELKTGKLDTKFLWGLATASAAAVIYGLVKRKLEGDREKEVVELDERTESRLIRLTDKIEYLEAAAQRAVGTDDETKFSTLLEQAVACKERLINSRQHSFVVRSCLESCEEALSAFETEVEAIEGPPTNGDNGSAHRDTA